MCVILSHTLTIATIPVYKNVVIGRIIANGTYAVDVFIILSGFVIFYLLESKRESYGTYIKRRALRIFPAYLVAFFLSLVILIISVQFLHELPWGHPKTSNRLEIFDETSRSFFINTISHLTLLHGLIPDSTVRFGVYSFIGQAWSLTLEWQFYLVAPALAIAYKKGTKLQFLIISSFILIEYSFKEYFGHRSFIFSNIALFLLGMACCRLYLEYKSRAKNTRGYFYRLLFILSCFLLYKSIVFGISHTIPILIFGVVLVSESTGLSNWWCNATRTLVNYKPVLWIGKISFSAYCLHMISLYCIGFCLINLIGIKSQYLYASLMVVVPFVITIFLSSVSYRFIEQPFMKYGR